ncbi:MAG: hypothetical protein AUJ07_05945 [Crenarchaeota archaeon 13_1_40CM_3_53_5]|nr:MAG: hypothetical protein AUJ07_05945 [Crenarchaeota archaeon 13_1_40CM_3_53_5]
MAMPSEYVPGKCNIGRRGRATRFSTGIIILGISGVFGFLFLRDAAPSIVRLILVLPFYGGLISILEGTMSFCVFHAARGTYDIHEETWRTGRSKTRVEIVSDEWRRADRRKARFMHAEAILGAIVLTAAVFFA